MLRAYTVERCECQGCRASVKADRSHVLSTAESVQVLMDPKGVRIYFDAENLHVVFKKLPMGRQPSSHQWAMEYNADFEATAGEPPNGACPGKWTLPGLRWLVVKVRGLLRLGEPLASLVGR